MKIAIIPNGLITDYLYYQSIINNYDMIICADGGLKHAFQMNICPHIAVGDFDSTPPAILDHYRNTRCKFIQYPPVKDETDTEIALQYALDQSPTCIDILAGLGDRFDHSLANVHLLLKGLEKNIPIAIITEHNEVMVIDHHIALKGKVGDGISLLPLTQSVTGICTEGLAYVVTNGTFTIGKPYGISNYMIADLATITIESGLLLVMRYKD